MKFLKLWSKIKNKIIRKTEITVPCLKLGVKNLNGRIYTIYSANSIIHSFRTSPTEIYVQENTGFVEVPPLEKICGVKELSINNDILNVTLHDIPKNIRPLIESGKAVIRPNCLGHVNSNGNVKIDTLISFALVMKEDDAYKDLI